MSGLAQGDALLHERHAQLFDALRLQVEGHRHQAVAVGIGLDDAHDRHACMGADVEQVEGQVVEVHHDPGGTLAHGVASCLFGALRSRVRRWSPLHSKL